MIISEVINALVAIKEKHGDLVVTHHDDWDFFVVDKVEYDEGCQPHLLLTGELDDAVVAPHVRIEGERSTSDLKGGWR